LQELSDEDFLEDDNDDDIDYEPEFIEQDDISSDSEQSLFDENNLPTGDDVRDDNYFFMWVRMVKRCGSATLLH